MTGVQTCALPILKMGQVVGQSDRYAARAVAEECRARHLLGTILHSMFDLGRLRLEPQVPREIIRIADESAPIGPLLS